MPRRPRQSPLKSLRLMPISFVALSVGLMVGCTDPMSPRSPDVALFLMGAAALPDSAILDNDGDPTADGPPPGEAPLYHRFWTEFKRM